MSETLELHTKCQICQREISEGGVMDDSVKRQVAAVRKYYLMPDEVLAKEIEAFEEHMAVCGFFLETTNHNKYKRGWLMRADRFYEERNNEHN